MHLEEIYSDLNGAINKLDMHPFWVEPIIGFQNQFTFKRWYMILQADYGGVFIDSKYSYQISTFAYYRTGKITSLKIVFSYKKDEIYQSLSHKSYIFGFFVFLTFSLTIV